MGAETCWHELRQLPDLTNVASDLQQQGLTVNLVIDRETAARFGITPATVDNALYDLFGQRIISTIYTQSNQYRVIMEAEPVAADLAECADGDLPAILGLHHRAGAAIRHRDGSSRSRGRCRSAISAQFPATTISFDTTPGSSLGAAVSDDPPGREGYRSAGEFRHGVPGRGGGVGGVAVERIAAGAGGDRHRLHRAGRAV